MATANYEFTGECRWAKLDKTDVKYNKYSIEVKLDEEGIALYNKAGCMGRPSKDGEGYYTFRRDPTAKAWVDGNQVPAGKPLVIFPDATPCHDLIGNGSKVTVKVAVYDYNNSFGKGKGTRLEAVCIENLIKFEKNAPKPAETVAGTKPRIPW
jgi:hypothetical protein